MRASLFFEDISRRKPQYPGGSHNNFQREVITQAPGAVNRYSPSLLFHMVLSQAARRIFDDWVAEFSKTPWHAIRAIGNKQEYQRVSDTILWGNVTTEAVQPKIAIEGMLAKHG